MFERYNEGARRVVVLAQEETQHFNHSYIGPEHLLLGLLREEEGVAARALGSLNVTLDEVREQVESIVGYGEKGIEEQALFTPQSKKVLELALREALQLGHDYIGTEHLLLGLVRESEGVAARVLANLEVDPDEVRHEVERLLSMGQAQNIEKADGGPEAVMRKWKLVWGSLKALIILLPIVLLIPRHPRRMGLVRMRARLWVAAWRQALAPVDRNENPEWWAWLHQSLGDALQSLGDSSKRNSQGDMEQNIEEALFHYRKALEVYTRDDFPKKWAMTQGNLAHAYLERIRGDMADNVEEAISHFELVLEVYTMEDFPSSWVTAQNSLAHAYSDRLRGDRAQNLERAISHCELALEAYVVEDLSEGWAMTQHNLAHVYSERIRGDKAENIEKAISHYRQALEVYTMDDLPEDWAGTQNSLALAYSDRIRGDKAENIEEAISRYEQALEIYTREALPVDWAATQHNLANAYTDRIRGDREQNIEEAISRYRLALEVGDRETFPLHWARIQNELAKAYKARLRGDRENNIEEAISRHKLALEIRDRETFPRNWAMTQHDLANTYTQRISGDREQNIEEAISRYRLALELLTRDTLPQDCRDTAYNLGRLLYGEGRYAESREALTTAHEAVEALRGELGRESSKQRLAEENADLYARLVYCCLIEGDEEAAFDYAVAGKGRAFVDMLATASFDLSAAGADDPQLGEDLRRVRELRQQIDNLLARLFGEGGASPGEDGEERGSVRSQMQAELRSLQDQEAAHWEEMSYRYPNLMATQQAPTLSVGEARRLSEELGATLVEFYQHAGGWCAFAVSPDGVGNVPLPGVDDGLLERMTGWLGQIESPKGRGKLSYERLHQLYEAVIAPLQDYLPPGGRVVLAPFANLHLMPLGATLDPDTGRYVAEDYTLTFAPNLAALRTAQQGASSDGAQGEEVSLDGDQDGEGLLSVAYPGAPDSETYLPNVLPEAEAVARHFARVTPLHEEEATPEAVLGSARGQDVLHLGCHGNFDSGHPQQSGLMLSGGWLTVQRVITELDLTEAKLATIGACLSGRVEVRQGEENVGLVQAMMSAGAGAVVASLWPVDDAATRALLEVFYAEVASGDSPAGALADAGALVRSRPGWEHPYYWAAFQVSGLAHGPYQPGLSHLSEEVVGRIEDVHRESVEKRGGLVMDETAIVRDSLVLLEQMGEEPEVVLEALGPGDREKVVATLGEISGQAAGVRTEADLLALANAVHRLVEETPALAELLLEPGSDPESQRTVPRLDEAAHDESQQAMEQAAQIRNRVVETNERLQQGLESGAGEGS